MQILNPGLLGTAADFRERFAVPIEKLGERERSEQLRKLVKPFVLRRLKTDPNIAGDLPEKMEMRVFCNLTPEQAEQYERLVAESLGQIDAAAGIRRRRINSGDADAAEANLRSSGAAAEGRRRATRWAQRQVRASGGNARRSDRRGGQRAGLHAVS